MSDDQHDPDGARSGESEHDRPADRDPDGGTEEDPTTEDVPNPDRPDDDPVAAIEAELERASDADETQTQHHLENIAAGLDRLEAWSEAPRPSRVSAVLDKLRDLEAEIDDPDERVHVDRAQRRLAALLDDPEYHALEEDERDEES